MKNSNLCVVDIELTEDKEIIQFAATKMDINFNEIESINYYIKPQKELSPFVTEFTGITNEKLENYPAFHVVAKEIYNFIKDCILVCHGLQSDYSVLKKSFSSVGITYKPSSAIDTVEFARLIFPTQKSYRLVDLSDSLNLYNGTDYHNAEVDVVVTVNLLKEFRKKIATIHEKNFNKIKTLLKKKRPEFLQFFSIAREYSETKNKNVSFIDFDDIKFRKASILNNPKLEKGTILFSCIDEYEYAKVNKVKEYEVLKRKSEYVPLNIFSLLPEEKDDNHINLYIKLYIWILETTTGEFSELNLLASEFKILEDIKNSISISSQAYYFNSKNEKARRSKNIITSYENIDFIFNNKSFAKYNFIFEDKRILGRELNIANVNVFNYKPVITELNVAISQNPNKKLLKNIQNNIESLVKFLHEMYISESLYLYNDSLDFILQDITEIKKSIVKSSVKIPITNIFINKLKSTLVNKKNSYKFEIIDSENSLVLKVIDDKNLKSTINLIHSRGTSYLHKNNKLTISYLKNIDDILTSKSQGKTLYVFESDKYRDLYFSRREKKSYIKHINFTSTDSFGELYADINKNNRLNYICYATRDILDYKQYLNLIFDNIIMLKDLEY